MICIKYRLKCIVIHIVSLIRSDIQPYYLHNKYFVLIICSIIQFQKHDFFLHLNVVYIISGMSFPVLVSWIVLQKSTKKTIPRPFVHSWFISLILGLYTLSKVSYNIGIIKSIPVSVLETQINDTFSDTFHTDINKHKHYFDPKVNLNKIKLMFCV